MIQRHNCGVIIIHHTNKPLSGKEKPTWSGSDFAYLGSGSAEWANWARAVLAIRSLNSHSLFELVAGKRGRRIGWSNEESTEPVYSKYIAHAREPGQIYWRKATLDEINAWRNDSKTKESESAESIILGLVPVDGQVDKMELIQNCQKAHVGRDRARDTIKQLVGRQMLFESEKGRSTGKPQVMVSRQPSPVTVNSNDPPQQVDTTGQLLPSVITHSPAEGVATTGSILNTAVSSNNCQSGTTSIPCQENGKQFQPEGKMIPACDPP